MSLGGAFVVAGVAFAGVHHGTRAILHVLVAISLAMAARFSERDLGRAGAAWTVSVAGACLAAATLPGLIPGVGTHPEDTLTAITHVVLIGGCALAVAAISAATRNPQALLWPLLWGSAGVAGLAAAHGVLQLDALFGVWAPESSRTRFYAPFVNPNHFAGFLLLATPVALGTALSNRRTEQRLVAAVLAVGFVGAIAWTAAAGPLVVMGLQLLMVAAMVWRPALLLGLPLLPAGGWVVSQWASRHGSDTAVSAEGRLELYTTTLRLLGAQPLTGAGLGTFEEAVQPHRSRASWRGWGHAHNDWLEWGAETGLVGIAALVVAVVLLAPWRWRPSRFVQRLGIGVGGVLLYAMVDFPLQIPLVAMAVAAAVAGSAAVESRGTPVAVPRLRVALWLCVVLQLGAGVWQARTAVVRRAHLALRADPQDTHARGWLQRLAPWRPDVQLAELSTAVGAGDTARVQRISSDLLASYPTNPTVVGSASHALLMTGSTARAVELAGEAVVLAPWNRELWKLRAVAQTRLDPSQAAPAWADAVTAGVPGAMQAGWKLLPVGLYWVDALDDAPPERLANVAAFLVEQGDLEAAIVGYQAVVDLEDAVVYGPYLRALQQTGRHGERLQYLDAVLRERPRHPVALRQRAVSLEALERWMEASEAWLLHLSHHGTGLSSAVAAKARATSLSEGQRLWDAQRLLGHTPSEAEVIDYASLHLSFGERRRCAQILAELGSSSAPARRLEDRCASR
ncbi:MAG: O-antigen ligase family protein [Myxococcales bacterium]|nr:O-antigen ligase family protein [Myxococcales bacterium]